MSVIDPAEARFESNDLPGATLPPAWVLACLLLAGALMWLAAGALAAAVLSWAQAR
jgi:hypothetical protein